jgi:hypothetical protein
VYVHRVSQRLGLIGKKVTADAAHTLLQALLPWMPASSTISTKPCYDMDSVFAFLSNRAAINAYSPTSAIIIKRQ